MPLQRLDATEIAQAGSFLERELLQILPKVYEKQYAPLWAEEGEYIPVSGAVSDYAEDIEEQIIEFAGKALEYGDKSMDIPVISNAISTDKYTIHTFAIATQHSIRELRRMEANNRGLKQKELMAVNRALRQSCHELLLFGSKTRNRTGLLNNPNVPLNNGSYDPNTSTWQEDVDFLCDTMVTIADRNVLTESTAWIILPNKLRNKYGRTYETASQGRSVLDAVMANFGTANGGTLRGIRSVNEVRATYLEKFGVKTPGTNEDRIVFLPANTDAVDRLAGAAEFMSPQQVDMEMRTVHFTTTSETMIHYPQAMQYEDVPQLA